ncbi:MAG: hypothetical protein ACLFS3_01705 [Candidatus Aenigmatarchaeota archaeon]
MVDFQNIDEKTIDHGNNNFIQVARTKAVSDDGENVFLSLSSGFYTEDKEKRFKKNFTLPDDNEVIDEIIEALQSLKE